MAFKAEKPRVAPCFYARAADADGDVALEYHAMLVGIFGCTLELHVQVVLDEEVEGTFG